MLSFCLQRQRAKYEPASQPTPALQKTLPGFVFAAALHVVPPSEPTGPNTPQAFRQPTNTEMTQEHTVSPSWLPMLTLPPPHCLCPQTYALQNTVYRYTHDEYDAVIAAEPSDWTRDETDQLFELCERFDLRFSIIADRLQVRAGFDRVLASGHICNAGTQ